MEGEEEDKKPRERDQVYYRPSKSRKPTSLCVGASGRSALGHRTDVCHAGQMRMVRCCSCRETCHKSTQDGC